MNQKIRTTTFRRISRDYNITGSVLKRFLMDKNIIYIKDVIYRKKGLIRAKDNYFCFDNDRNNITYFYVEKVFMLMEYLGLKEVPSYQKICKECLIAKDIYCYHHAGVHTCKVCLKKQYAIEVPIESKLTRKCSRCLEIKDISLFYTKAYKCKRCSIKYQEQQNKKKTL